VRILIGNPALAEIMVIHEMLHTLGLGENRRRRSRSRTA
jgi:hypothetical protein